jgi:aerobic-type carbon monoxide dehydrogenase small subunit (CoxS/CutS family)
MALKQALSLSVNGVPWQGYVDSNMTLLDFLREELNLTGTKRGCDMGDCGCCVIHLNGKPILACLYPVIEAQDAKVRTIEGIANGPELHPVQVAMVEEGAIQCGFCTPAMVMNGVNLIEENPNPSDRDIKSAIAGTICRCTGYTKIEKAFRCAVEKVKNL